MNSDNDDEELSETFSDLAVSQKKTVSEYDIFTYSPKTNEEEARQELREFFKAQNGRGSRFCRAMSVHRSNMSEYLVKGKTRYSCRQALEEFYSYSLKSRHSMLNAEFNRDFRKNQENPLVEQITVKGSRGRTVFQWEFTKVAKELFEKHGELIPSRRINHMTNIRPRIVVILYIRMETDHSRVESMLADFEPYSALDHVRFVDNDTFCGAITSSKLLCHVPSTMNRDYIRNGSVGTIIRSESDDKNGTSYQYYAVTCAHCIDRSLVSQPQRPQNSNSLRVDSADNPIYMEIDGQKIESKNAYMPFTEEYDIALLHLEVNTDMENVINQWFEFTSTNEDLSAADMSMGDDEQFFFLILRISGILSVQNCTYLKEDEIELNREDINQTTCLVKLKNQIVFEALSEGGDSGSVMIHRNGDGIIFPFGIVHLKFEKGEKKLTCALDFVNFIETALQKIPGILS